MDWYPDVFMPEDSAQRRFKLLYGEGGLRHRPLKCALTVATDA